MTHGEGVSPGAKKYTRVVVHRANGGPSSSTAATTACASIACCLRHLRDEKGVSRNRIQKWIEAGDVLINGAAPPRAAWRIQSGDELQSSGRAPFLPRARPRA